MLKSFLAAVLLSASVVLSPIWIFLAGTWNSPSRGKFILVEKTSSDVRGSILGDLCGSFVGHNLECDFASVIQSLVRQELSIF